MMKNIKFGLYIAVIFGISFVFAKFELYVVSGLVLLLLAAALYVCYFLKSNRNLLDMRGVYSLAWIGGMGLSALKLSLLQEDWHIITWVCLYLAYISFIFGYEYKSKLFSISKKQLNQVYKEKYYEKGLIICIRVVVILSMAAFLAEVVILGYIPVFSSDPEAYSMFHISGVHYFTVSTMFILPLNIIYYCLYNPFSKIRVVELLLYSILSIAVPVLIVSRALLMMTVIISFVCAVNLFDKIKVRYLIAGGLMLVALYIFISVSRNHGVEYLNSIYQMKKETPIFISQPYIYIANNYDNFNELVKNIKEYSFGIASLTPVFSLTGLKFILNLPVYPVYTNIVELTTGTYLYDIYYDFGVIGVVILPLFMGYICSRVKSVHAEKHHPIKYFAEGIFLYILLFSFFTPWFSNPTIWFYFIAVIAMYITINKIASYAYRKCSVKI